jgi:hypothetical protein
MALLTRGRKHSFGRDENSVILTPDSPSSLQGKSQEEEEGGEPAVQPAKSKVIGMIATLLIH